jgi:hypothetical protein
VAPDGVLTLLRVAGGLVAACVDDLEVVDEPVGLVEVAVTVDVVAVPVVERLQVVGHLLQGLAGVELALDPVGHRVADQEVRVGADDPAAEVAAVAGLVERHLDPLRDRPVDRVPTRGLVVVVLLHAVEVHVLVVGLVVVGLPQGRVVDRTVRLRDRVVQRPVEACGSRRRPGVRDEVRE